MLYYLCYDSGPETAKNRYASPAGMNKLGYISDCLRACYPGKIEKVSLSELKDPGFEKGYTRVLQDNYNERFFLAYRSKSKVLSRLGHYATKISEFCYLLKNVNQEDTLVVYHSLFNMGLVRAVKKWKKCNLILQVEELYADVKNNPALREKEITYLQLADSYIFITKLLEQQVNHSRKPYAIAHGTYKVNPIVESKGFEDDKIHVVYAGTLNRSKTGVHHAVQSAQFLDDRFVMHILGKGAPEEEKRLVSLIKSVENHGCPVIFEGFLSGDDLNGFIQSCDIGMSTQPIDATFNDSSFPSKVLMYFSNGIPVVSVAIPAVQTSDVGNMISYYYHDTPEDIAKAIKEASEREKPDIRHAISELDQKFRSELSKLLKLKEQCSQMESPLEFLQE